MPTILLVDDELYVRRATSRILRRQGYVVLEAADGARAVELSDAHEGNIDLLLTDSEMPGMRGSELARQILAKRHEIRVLFVSGYSEDETIREQSLAHTATFLAKPFTISELGRAVDAALAPEKAGAR